MRQYEKKRPLSKIWDTRRSKYRATVHTDEVGWIGDNTRSLWREGRAPTPIHPWALLLLWSCVVSCCGFLLVLCFVSFFLLGIWLRQSGIAATIKKARAKMANRKYTHVSHQYSLDFADAEVNELGKSSDFYGLACLGMPYVEVRVMCT